MSDLNNGSVIEPTVTPDPDQGQSDKSEAIDQAPSNENLPEQFQGKSAAEIAKSYQELQKKLGEHSSELEKARKAQKMVDDWENLLQGNPDLYEKALEVRTRQNKPVENKKDDGEVRQPSESDQYLRNQALVGFERTYLSNFDADKKQELFEKTAKKFMDMRDPGGNKDFSTIVAETPISQLDAFMSDAFFLATRDSAAMNGVSHDFASIGSIPSSTRKSDGNDLTEDELSAAKIFGMTPEEYKKYKNK